MQDMDNKVGIAAGLDKNGDYIDCLAALGVDLLNWEQLPLGHKAETQNRDCLELKKKKL